MNLFDPTESPVLLGGLLLVLTLVALRMRQRQSPRRQAQNAREALDTVAGWPPETSRVLSIHERQAYDLLRRALPGFLVLAQVPLSRFLRVPTRHSYTDWLQRAGSLSADILLCDSGSRVLAVVDIRSPQETERSRRRHERLGRVLKAAGIKVYTWREGMLPTLSELRSSIGGDLAPPEPAAKVPGSKPMPLIPVADIHEVLADGDLANYDAGMEPLPSGYYEDLESVRGQLSKA
jgi:hypothetical protein